MSDTEGIQDFLKNKISEIDCMLTQETYLNSVKCLSYDEIMCIGIYEPNPNKGFMFTKDKNMENLMKKIYENYDKHSGASMGITMQWIKEMYKEYLNEINNKI